MLYQVMRAGTYSRQFHGTVEISDGSDVLRTFWHTQFETHWPLPIVLVATPVSP